MDHEAVLTFEYDSVDLARRVASSIEPELGDIDDDRSRVKSVRSDAVLEIRVAARDFVALRASLNTWLSLLSVAEDVSGVR